MKSTFIVNIGMILDLRSSIKVKIPGGITYSSWLRSWKTSLNHCTNQQFWDKTSPDKPTKMKWNKKPDWKKMLKTQLMRNEFWNLCKTVYGRPYLSNNYLKVNFFQIQKGSEKQKISSQTLKYTQSSDISFFESIDSIKNKVK